MKKFIALCFMTPALTSVVVWGFSAHLGCKPPLVCADSSNSLLVQQGQKSHESPVETPPKEPSLEQIRQAAIKAFVGPPSYDETARLTIRDHQLPESVALASCRSVKWVKQKAIELFSEAGFEEEAVTQKIQYLEHNLPLVRELSSRPRRIDILVFYFNIEKSAGIRCKYHFGVLGRREAVSPRMILKGSEHDRLFRDVRTLIDHLENSLTDPQQMGRPEVQRVQDVYSYLSSHETKDPILSEAARGVREVIPSIIPSRTTAPDTVDIFVTEFGDDVPLRFRQYKTDNCMAVQMGLRHPSIICNARYLAEAEMAIRAFEDASAFFQEEGNLLKFIELSTARPQEMLLKMRSDKELASRTDQSTQHIGLHLMLALLFFSSHELGHLLEGTDFRSYIDIVSAGNSLDTQVRTAVVKMCRHADQFARYDFGLPGMASVTEASSDIRRVEETFKQEMIDVFAATQRLFQSEEKADAIAIEATLRYLSALDGKDSEAALEQQHLLLETLFVLGIYRWYKDFAHFTEKECGRIENSNMLAICMARSRGRYIAASSIFGEVHRFVLLRTVLTMDAIIEKRMTYFSLPADQQTIWVTKEELEHLSKTEALHVIWRKAALQRYFLLSILMDTPVKFAYTACATGWIMEVDKKRGSPQGLMMLFEPLEVAFQRLLKFP